MTDAFRNPPLRLAIFSEVYWPMVSGVGVTLVRLADALMARGHQVRIYAPSYPMARGAHDRPEVFRVPSVPFFLYRDVQWAFPRVKAVVEDARGFRPDLVHVATEFSLGVTGIKVARALDVPVVASAHTDYEQYADKYYGVGWAIRAGWHYMRWFYGQSEKVLCPSRLFERHMNRRGVRHTGIWSRGIDAALFHPKFRSNDYRRRFGAGDQDLLVTYVGRIAREKNLDMLLDAWELLGARHHNAQLVLVGGGPLEEEIRRRAVPRVHLAGVLPQGTDLATAYASADLFVFPSTSETFGNVLLEAMASGLPAVVAAAGGVLEMAQHGENGWLVQPDDVDALIGGIDRLLTDRDLRGRLATGALATARNRSWDRVYDLLEQDYAAIVQGHPVTWAA